jgi:hypothetical protein
MVIPPEGAELVQVKCQYVDLNYLINLQELSIDQDQ